MEAAHFYVLPFVSAATLGGASLVDFTGCFQNMNIEFDGSVYSKEELRDCLNEPPGRCGELGLGVKFALSAGAREVKVISGSGRAFNVMEVDERETRFFSTPISDECSTPINKVVVRGCEIAGDAPYPYNFLCRRCGYSGTVAWQGKRIRGTRPDESCGSIRFNRREGEDPAVAVHSWTTAKLDHPELNGQVWLKKNGRTEIRFLLNGVVYPSGLTCKRYPGLSGLLAYPRVRLDISRSGVVVDQNLEKLVIDIESRVETSLFPRLLRSYRGMMPAHRESATRFLRLWEQTCPSAPRDRIQKLLAD